MEKFNKLKAVVDYKTEFAWKALKELETSLEQIKEEGNDERAKVFEGFVKYQQATWSAYRDIQEAIALINK